MIATAQFAVVAAAHFAVAELRAQRRRDLQVRAHLQHAIVRRPGGVISSVLMRRV